MGDTKPQEGTLAFSFFIEKMLIEQRIAVVEYVKIPASDRLLLALGYANSFTYPNNGYIRHVRRLFGRGLVEERQAEEMFEKALKEAIEESLIKPRPDERYDITEKGRGYLAKYSFKPVELSVNHNGHQSPQEAQPKEVEKPLSKRPSWVVEPFKGDIDDERQQRLSKLRYRTVEFLSELEIVGGEVRGVNPVVTLFRQAERKIDISSYNKVAEKLIEKGIIEIDVEGEFKVIRFTELGKEYVAQLKVLPEVIDKLVDTPEKLNQGSSFKILEYLSENAQFIDENQVHWFRALGNEEPVMLFLADQVNLSYDSFVRRVYSLRVLKEYLVEQKNSRGEVINLGVTQEGFSFIQRVIDKKRKEEKILDDEAIEYAVSLAITAIELARAVGENGLASRLNEENDTVALSELSEVDLEEHTFTLEKLVDRLRHEFLFENS